MNEKRTFALVDQLWSDLLAPDFIWQVLALLLVLAVAWWLSYRLRKGSEERHESAEAPSALRKFGAGSLKRIAFPLVALVLVWVLAPLLVLRSIARRSVLATRQLGRTCRTGEPPGTAADVLVLPSDAGETWGLVVNEALASGRPAVVSRAAGCAADLVVENETGRTFACGDVATRPGKIKLIASGLAEAAAAVAHAVGSIRPESELQPEHSTTAGVPGVEAPAAITSLA